MTHALVLGDGRGRLGYNMQGNFEPTLTWISERTDGGLSATHDSFLFGGGAEQVSHLSDGASGGTNTFAASPFGTGLAIKPQGGFMFALRSA